MMLGKFQNRSPNLVENGMMIFDGQVVCKTAFYQLYGFGKTLFFEYQKKYNDGAKVGFHWGTGLQKPTENMTLGV